MAQFSHGQRGTLEADAIAVHEQHDFLAACDGEAPRYLALQTLFRLRRALRRLQGHAACRRGLRERVRYRGKATELRASAPSARGCRLRPNSIIGRSERDGARALGRIRRVAGAVRRRAIGKEEQIERGRSRIDRRVGEQRLRVRSGVNAQALASTRDSSRNRRAGTRGQQRRSSLRCTIASVAIIAGSNCRGIRLRVTAHFHEKGRRTRRPGGCAVIRSAPRGGEGGSGTVRKPLTVATRAPSCAIPDRESKHIDR